MYFTDTPELRKFEREMQQKPNFDRRNDNCDKGLSAHIEWPEALVVFQKLAGGEWSEFGFEPSGFGFEPSPCVQSEPPQGKIKKCNCDEYVMLLCAY